MPRKFALFARAQRSSRGQRHLLTNLFVFVGAVIIHVRFLFHCGPQPGNSPLGKRCSNFTRIASSALRRRVFTVGSGTFSTSAISSNFISSSNLSVNTSQ